MMKFLKELFSKEPKLYSIEKDSIAVNKELFDLIVKAEKIVNELQKILGNENISFKDAKLAELENSLINIKSKIDALKLNIQHIFDIEMKHKDYILLNDDFFLKDKLSRIETMNQVAEELLDLIGERPTARELSEMISHIHNRMSNLVDSVNNISSDDKHLEDVYSRLKQI